MNTSSQSIRQFSLIFDQIYTQKQKVFSQKITKWHKDKQQFLSSNYIKSIDHMFQEVESDHKKFQKRIHELLKVANAEFQMLSKVRTLNEQKDTLKNNNVIVVQSSLASEETQMFQSIMQRIYKKASDIHELSEFASRFFAITSTELNEFKSLTSQIQNRKQRYLFDFKKQTVEDNRVLNQLCLKSQSKYFQVRSYQKLRQCMEKQMKILSKTNDDVRQYYKQSLHKRKQILQNCIDNMTRYEELSMRIFHDNMIGEIRGYFNKLVQQLDKVISAYEAKEKQYLNVKESIDKEYERIFQENIEIFNSIMEDITLGEWRNIALQTFKKSSFSSFSPMNFGSHHALREETFNDDSNKQFAVPVSHKDVSSNSQHQMLLTLTIDYKLLFRKMSEKNKICKQYFLNDLKVKSQKDKKKVLDERRLILKQKNKKQTLQISFSDADKREEFLLHLQRFQQLRNTLGK